MHAVLTVTAETDPPLMNMGITLDTRREDVIAMEEDERLEWMLERARERLALLDGMR